MRIDVHDRGDFGDQTRAYAEYRVFSMLRNFSGVVRHVSVALAPDDRDNSSGEGVVCRTTLTMTNGGRLETLSRGRHACAAIDDAASRTRALMEGQPSAVA